MSRYSSHERGDAVDLPSWWLDRVNEMKEHRGDTITELGKMLAAVVGRATAFDHGTVSRFLNNRVTTRQLTDAFVRLYGIPSPFFEARSLDEAMAMQGLARKYDAPVANSNKDRRLAAADQRAEHERKTAQDQTDGVTSPDEGAGQHRRPGRATRRRTPPA
jgi:hypothetical protein